MSHRLEMPDAVNNNVHSSASSDEFIYDLYAVCNHFGNLQGGHYTGKLCNNIEVFLFSVLNWFDSYIYSLSCYLGHVHMSASLHYT